MNEIERLIENNRAWAEGIKRQDPGFFRTQAAHQAPEYLWIGCSDSRVPGTDVVGLMPGELFVHRNIANLVVSTDVNCMSVIHYAVCVLQVKHVIVCGHYGCGGVTAAVQNKTYGVLDNWLRHLKDLCQKHEETLDAIADRAARADRLSELNVVEQVHHVCQTSSVQEAWRSGHRLAVHGWMYSLKDGLVTDLGVSITSPEQIAPIYRVPSSPLG